mgnify:CR=1 FL=1
MISPLFAVPASRVAVVMEGTLKNDVLTNVRNGVAPIHVVYVLPLLAVTRKRICGAVVEYKPSMLRFLNTFSEHSKKYTREEVAYLESLFDTFCHHTQTDLYCRQLLF